MKNIKKARKNLAYFLTFIIVQMQFLSCSTNQSDIASNSKNYSAKEVFKGVIFLEGDFAEEIPTLKSLKVQQEIMYENALAVANRSEKGPSIFGDFENMSDEKKAIAEYFTNEIEKINPEFFNEFQAAIDSRNPEIVRTKLRAAGEMIKTVLLSSDKMQRIVEMVELAKTEGGIDISNYDLTDEKQVAQYNSDLTVFVENNHPEYLDIDSKAAVIGVVLIVVVWAFVAYGVLAAVGMFGVVLGAYFVAGELYVVFHNQFWRPAEENPDSVFLENQLISELLDYNLN